MVLFTQASPCFTGYGIVDNMKVALYNKSSGKGTFVQECSACAKCKRPIERGESTISTVKNLKRLYYHARCFGADHLETDPPAKPKPDVNSQAQ